VTNGNGIRIDGGRRRRGGGGDPISPRAGKNRNTSPLPPRLSVVSGEGVTNNLKRHATDSPSREIQLTALLNRIDVTVCSTQAVFLRRGLASSGTRPSRLAGFTSPDPNPTESMNATRQTLPIRLFPLSVTAWLALGLAFAVGSLKAAGEADIGFNPNLDGGVRSLAVQADGKVLIGGYFETMGGVSRRRIARLNADGSLDTGFNPNANDEVSSLAVQADGKVLIGGNFTTVGGVTRNHIARLNTDGSLDIGFNPIANGWVNSLAVQADGKVLIGGNFTTVGGVARNNVARLNTDGSLDTGFNPNASFVGSLAVQADGKVLIGGFFTTVGGVARNRIARLNADGSLDTGFNPTLNGGVGILAVQADGKVLIGGEFTIVGGVARNRIARLNADGSLDTGFNPNADDNVDSLAVQADGKLLIGGDFFAVGGAASNYVTRLWVARLANDPATQSLTIPDSTRVLWIRGGSAPEVSDVVFEQSLDGGVTWTLLGAGARIGVSSDWERTGLSLDAGVKVRATGRTIGGLRNGSSGLIRQVHSADPKPDLSIGSDPTAATGVGVYPPTSQSIALLSRRGAPVPLFAKVANEGLLPDAMRLRGSSGDNFFAVSYSTAAGNVTAQMIAGSFATPVLSQDDSPVTLTVSVSPNKRLLTKKVKKGKRVLTTTLRKTYSGFIEATATDDPARSDRVRYQVTTAP